MKLSISSLLLASLLFTGPAGALSSNKVTSAQVDSSNEGAHDWVAERGDNLCGISALKRVTHPARVDYEAVLAATPQMIEMKNKGIEPDSIEGRTLREAARSLIVGKAQLVQKNGGYCGLWKVIENKDGRAIDNVTQDLIALF